MKKRHLNMNQQQIRFLFYIISATVSIRNTEHCWMVTTWKVPRNKIVTKQCPRAPCK